MSRAAMVALFAALSVSAQAQTPGGFEAPRTGWGDPDLGGLWSSATVTPAERPEGQADEFLSAEEVAAAELAVADATARANAPSEVRTEALPVGGNVGAYNSFWLDRGTRVVPTRRTSIVIDPPDGRLPPLTPDTARRLASPEAQRLLENPDGACRSRIVRAARSWLMTRGVLLDIAKLKGGGHTALGL